MVRTDEGVLLERVSKTLRFQSCPEWVRDPSPPASAHDGSRILESSGNDLVALAQILGHESLNTKSRYTRRTQNALAESAEKVVRRMPR